MVTRDRLAMGVGALLCGALGTGGCFAIANLDRFHADGGAAGGTGGTDDPTQPSSLSLTLHDFGFHYQQLIEFRVIDSQNRLQCRGVIQPLDQAGTVQITLNAPKAILPTNQPYRLDFYADVNDSGTYDGIGNVLKQDHAWRIEPLTDYPPGEFTHVANLVQVFFEHNTDFTDIDSWPDPGQHNPPQDTGLAARVRFDGASMAQWQGKLVQLRITEAVSGHVVGLYRNPQIPSGDFVADIQGVLDPMVGYYLEIYVDGNGDGVYQNPAQPSASADLGWRIAVQANDGTSDAGSSGQPYGIDYAFNARTEANPNNADVGAP